MFLCEKAMHPANRLPVLQPPTIAMCCPTGLMPVRHASLTPPPLVPITDQLYRKEPQCSKRVDPMRIATSLTPCLMLGSWKVSHLPSPPRDRGLYRRIRNWSLTRPALLLQSAETTPFPLTLPSALSSPLWMAPCRLNRAQNLRHQKEEAPRGISDGIRNLYTRVMTTRSHIPAPPEPIPNSATNLVPGWAKTGSFTGTALGRIRFPTWKIL